METFSTIRSRAEKRKGGKAALKKLIRLPKTKKQLKDFPDNFYLSEFSRKVFQSGFVWSVVDKKWPNFEQLFFDFNPDKLVLFSDERIEELSQDVRIIRHYKKICSIRDNAMMIKMARDKGSFGAFIAKWPESDIVGLWQYLKKEGSRLGGNTGPYALRSIGKDTFVASNDVVGYLKNFDLLSVSPSSKRGLKEMQSVFNLWQKESGKTLSEISQTIAFSFGEKISS